MYFNFNFIAILFSTTFLAANAFPRETSRDDLRLAPVTTTFAPAQPITTEAPQLRCTNGSTIRHTVDCTMRTPVSYCHKPNPMACEDGFFPSVWHPDHCDEIETCFPIDASWITTECSNGAYAASTSTLYEGTLADGEWTVLSVVDCHCATDQWYSATMLEGGSKLETFCMPYRSCPPGMTKSTSTNAYCATATTGACLDTQYTTEYCECADPMQTPVYDDDPEEGAIGCE